MHNEDDVTRFIEAAVLFQALSDPGRLRTLTLLAQSPCSVTHLAEVTGERVGTVSARLKVLLHARLVTRCREGQLAIYSIADGHVFQLVTNALEHVAEHK